MWFGVSLALSIQLDRYQYWAKQRQSRFFRFNAKPKASLTAAASSSKDVPAASSSKPAKKEKKEKKEKKNEKKDVKFF